MRILIDAGHGGTDIGCKSLYNLQEKNVTLTIAKKLGCLLSQNHIDTIYTRQDDRTLTLATRADLANHSDSDYFISIHVDYTMQPNTSGFTIYVPPNEASAYNAATQIVHCLTTPTLLDANGIIKKHLFLLTKVTIPTLIIVISYGSNKYEADLLLNDEFLNYIASRIAKGLLSL